MFWSIEGTPASEVDLEFDQDFVAERAPPTQMIPTYPTVPVIEDNLSSSEGFRTASYSELRWAGVVHPAFYSERSWAGAVCLKHSRCNQRRHWSRWTCLGEGCIWEYSPYREVITTAAAMGDQVFQYEGHALSEEKSTKLVNCDRKVHGFSNIHEYLLSSLLAIRSTITTLAEPRVLQEGFMKVNRSRLHICTKTEVELMMFSEDHLASD